MGDSKRKQTVTAAQSQLLQVLDGLSEGPRVPGLEPVQVLAFRLNCAEEVRAKLGQMPALVDKLIEGAAEGPREGKTPQAVLWEHWPGGRQVGRLLTKFEEVQMLYCPEIYSNAAVRGWEVRIAAFPDKGWSGTMHEVREVHARNLAQIIQLMAAAPPLVHEHMQGLHAIRVPLVLDEGMRAGLVGQVLRLLDAMAASQSTLQKNFGRILLAFDGYDDDPREVWDIPHPREFMRRLHHHAPWWPLLIGPGQPYVWLAPQLAKAPAKVSPADGLVGFPMNQGQALALLSALSRNCVDALFFAGFDMAEPRTTQMLVQSLQPLSEGLRMAEERYANIVR